MLIKINALQNYIFNIIIKVYYYKNLRKYVKYQENNIEIYRKPVTIIAIIYIVKWCINFNSSNIYSLYILN